MKKRFILNKKSDYQVAMNVIKEEHGMSVREIALETNMSLSTAKAVINAGNVVILERIISVTNFLGYNLVFEEKD